MSPEQTPPTVNRGEAQFDEVYSWGRPTATYLGPRQIVRLTILRSRLDDRHLLRNRMIRASDANE